MAGRVSSSFDDDDPEFQAFLDETISDESRSTSRQSSRLPQRGGDGVGSTSLWFVDNDGEGSAANTRDGSFEALAASASKWIKPKPAASRAPTAQPQPEPEVLRLPHDDPLSLTTDSLAAAADEPGPGDEARGTSPGSLDNTLQEERDKQRFFQELEQGRGPGRPTDYAALNKKVDLSAADSLKAFLRMDPGRSSASATDDDDYEDDVPNLGTKGSLRLPALDQSYSADSFETDGTVSSLSRSSPPRTEPSASVSTRSSRSPQRTPVPDAAEPSPQAAGSPSTPSPRARTPTVGVRAEDASSASSASSEPEKRLVAHWSDVQHEFEAPPSPAQAPPLPEAGGPASSEATEATADESAADESTSAVVAAPAAAAVALDSPRQSTTTVGTETEEEEVEEAVVSAEEPGLAPLSTLLPTAPVHSPDPPSSVAAPTELRGFDLQPAVEAESEPSLSSPRPTTPGARAPSSALASRLTPRTSAQAEKKPHSTVPLVPWRPAGIARVSQSEDKERGSRAPQGRPRAAAGPRPGARSSRRPGQGPGDSEAVASLASVLQSFVESQAKLLDPSTSRAGGVHADRAALAASERAREDGVAAERHREHEAQIRDLEQTVFVLKARLAATASSGAQQSTEGAPSAGAEGARAESELEGLLLIYEKENKRLCDQIKDIEGGNKAVEKLLFNENQGLRAQLSRALSDVEMSPSVQLVERLQAENERLQKEVARLGAQVLEAEAQARGHKLEAPVHGLPGPDSTQADPLQTAGTPKDPHTELQAQAQTIRRLKRQIASQDETHVNVVRTLQHKHSKMCAAYDERIERLEDQRDHQHQQRRAAPPLGSNQHPYSRVKELQQELEVLRERHARELEALGVGKDKKEYEKRVRALLDEISTLKLRLAAREAVQDEDGLIAGQRREAHLEDQNSTLTAELAGARNRLAVLEATVSEVVSESAQKVEQLAAEKEAEVQQALATAAVQHSQSEVVRMQQQIDSFKVVVADQNRRLANNPGPDAVRAYERKIRRLEAASTDLRAKLAEARQHHHPTMVHFAGLEAKISDMEGRHSQREAELKRMLLAAERSAELELEAATNRWKQVVQEKQMEIDRFRGELDSILDVLRTLQAQGLVLSAPKAGPAPAKLMA